MKFNFTTGFAALGCVLFAACHPYKENPKSKPTASGQKTVTTPEQQKLQAQRDAMKAKDEAKKKDEVKITPPEGPETHDAPPKPPIDEKKTEYARANKVPGKDGFVFSPYNNKVVDVRDIPSGTLVQDPTYTGAGKGYFRVP